MADLKIRKAQMGDLLEIQEVARRTIDLSYRAFLGDEAVDWYLGSGESDGELQKHIGNCDVVLNAGDIVAFAIYFDDLVHLMMVDVALHRTGIGSTLLAHCEEKLFRRGHSSIRLETFKGNHQAINFYWKNGWSVSHRQEHEDHGFERVFFEKGGKASHPPVLDNR